MSLTPTTIKYDEGKLAELILYVAEHMSEDPSFGATKLNKVLFFSDFLAYRTFGAPITGAAYMKLPHGPVPRRLLPVQQALVGAGDATLIRKEHLGYPQKRLVALRSADLDAFDAEEINLVDEVMGALRGQSASQVSQTSHRLSVGWQIAEVQADIPYNSVFLSTRPMTELDAENVRRKAKELGLVA